MNNLNKIKIFLLIFIIFLTSFGLGFLTRDKINFIYQPLGNNTFTNDNSSFSLKDTFLNKDLDLTLFWQVYNLVAKNFYSSGELNKKDLQYGVIKGYMSSLGDKFSEFMTPEETKEFEDVLNGDFEGIGAIIDKHELGIIVDRVLKGSPALNNGIKKGDIIVEANGHELKDLSVNDAVNFIKGPSGSEVTLKIIRQGENDFLIKKIIRDKVNVPSVDYKVFEKDRLGYIALNIFGENTSKEFNEALSSLNNENIDGIIIDLRDNGGGYLQSAVEILSNFVEKGKLLVTTKYKDAVLNNYYYSENNGDIYNKKIVVLINGNSASASEITAGALRDYNKVILLGEKSYGKGSVQQPFTLPDGSLLKLTIAKWYTPKDYSIDKNGIKPDIEVNFSREDFEKLYDRQLESAKEVLKNYIKLDNISLVVSEYEKSHPKTGSGETNTTSSGSSN